MENAVEALKMAFAVILLTLALGLSINMFSKARATSDIVLRSSDETEYYDYMEYTDADKTGNRVVGMETIIPTLYKYNKERYKVIFKKGNYDYSNGNLSNVTPLEIYETTTNPSAWSNNYINDFDGKNKDQHPSKKICSIDIEEEIQRGEPWTSNPNEISKHLNALISGNKYYLPQFVDNYIDYKLGKLKMGSSITGISKSQLPNFQKNNKKFVEQIGKKITTDESSIKGNKTTSKMIITYILIN